MKKRLSFIVLIATLHLLFALAAGSQISLAENGNRIAGPLAKLLLCPLFFPLRGIMPSSFAVPVLVANSLLWGLMGERMVWGRRKLFRRKRAKNV